MEQSLIYSQLNFHLICSVKNIGVICASVSKTDWCDVCASGQGDCLFTDPRLISIRFLIFSIISLTSYIDSVRVSSGEIK